MTADYSFVNERLARHYGMPRIYGTQFRRVTVSDERRGLLGKGAILMATSHAHRTSPVLRGKWVLENIIGVSPAPPPDDVPALNDEERPSSWRPCCESLEQHRANPACASCHRVLDPTGSRSRISTPSAPGALETGERWASEIDASGQLVDGTKVDGAMALRQVLVREPETFVRTFTEKLLTYAVGRGLTAAGHARRPVGCRVTRATRNYRFSSLVLGIVHSAPFQMRTAGGSRIGHDGSRRGFRLTRSDRRCSSLRQSVSRRAVLQGVGATLALPLLEAMVPAATALAKTAAHPVPRDSARYLCRWGSRRG